MSHANVEPLQICFCVNLQLKESDRRQQSHPKIYVNHMNCFLNVSICHLRKAKQTTTAEY